MNISRNVLFRIENCSRRWNNCRVSFLSTLSPLSLFVKKLKGVYLSVMVFQLYSGDHYKLKNTTIFVYNFDYKIFQFTTQGMNLKEICIEI